MRQFFQDESGAYSMARLLNFLSFWPAAHVLVALPGEGTLGVFLTAYVGGYVGSKWIDQKKGKDTNADTR